MLRSRAVHRRTARVVSGANGGLLHGVRPAVRQRPRSFQLHAREAALQTVTRVTCSRDGGLTLDPSSEEVLLTVDQPFSNHNGGTSCSGRMGSCTPARRRCSSGDPQDNARTTHVAGQDAAHRRERRHGYTIPVTNPFAATAAVRRERQRALPGDFRVRFRNPWRFSSIAPRASSGSATSPGAWEEVDRVVAGALRLRFREGAHCFEPASGCPTAHDGSPSRSRRGVDHDTGESITGGMSIGHGEPGSWAATVADFISGRLFAHDPGRPPHARDAQETSLSIASFAQDEDGDSMSSTTRAAAADRQPAAAMTPSHPAQRHRCVSAAMPRDRRPV